MKQRIKLGPVRIETLSLIPHLFHLRERAELQRLAAEEKSFNLQLIYKQHHSTEKHFVARTRTRILGAEGDSADH